MIEIGSVETNVAVDLVTEAGAVLELEISNAEGPVLDVVLATEETVIELATAPVGGTGPPVNTRFEHVQATPLTEWSVPHPFGVIPTSYLIIDQDGEEVDGDPAEISAVRLVLRFAHPTSGIVIIGKG